MVWEDQDQDLVPCVRACEVQVHACARGELTTSQDKAMPTATAPAATRAAARAPITCDDLQTKWCSPTDSGPPELLLPSVQGFVHPVFCHRELRHRDSAATRFGCSWFAMPL